MNANNETLAQFKRVLYDKSVVGRVEHFMDPDLPKGPVAVRVSFGDCVFYVRARGEDDSIDVSSSPLDESLVESVVMDVSAREPWCRIVGARMIWCWALTNNQGYTDGVQFEFLNDSLGSVCTVQLMVAASTMEVRTVMSMGQSDA